MIFMLAEAAGMGRVTPEQVAAGAGDAASLAVMAALLVLGALWTLLPILVLSLRARVSRIEAEVRSQGRDLRRLIAIQERAAEQLAYIAKCAEYMASEPEPFPRARRNPTASAIGSNPP